MKNTTNQNKVLASANNGKPYEPLRVWMRRINDEVMSTPENEDERSAVMASGAVGIRWK